MQHTKRILITLATLASVTGFSAPLSAQDYGPYGYDGLGFDWDGFYAGAYGGGTPFDGPSYNAGILAGVNATFDSVLLGAEARLGLAMADNYAIDALALSKGGITFGDAAAYATGGVGMMNGGGAYALGGGLGYGVTDYMSVRVEGLGTAPWTEMPNALRLSAGLAFHM